jgi:hypothetical protein
MEPSKARELATVAATDQTEPRNESRHDMNTFDTGIRAWLQVLGAFFLWFNTWYAQSRRTHSLFEGEPQTTHFLVPYVVC